MARGKGKTLCKYGCGKLVPLDHHGRDVLQFCGPEHYRLWSLQKNNKGVRGAGAVGIDVDSAIFRAELRRKALEGDRASLRAHYDLFKLTAMWNPKTKTMMNCKEVD